MKELRLVWAMVSVVILLIACNDKNIVNDEPETPDAPQTYAISGKVEKGPFVSGSTVTMQPMNDRLQVLGDMYSTVITDDLGNFVFGSKVFSASYAEMMATGYFFNEVKGELSSSTLTLRALADLSSSNTLNVNILTHIKYARVKKLIAEGKNYKDADSQALDELMGAFGLQQMNDKDVSTFSIIAGTDEAAALLAISSLLLMERSEAAFTEYLAKLSEDFGNNGTFSDELQQQIDEDKSELAMRIDDVRINVIERYNNLGMAVEVKDLIYFIDWNNDGVAGNEMLRPHESVSLDTECVEVPNEGGTFTVHIEAPIELYLEPQMNANIDITPDSSIEELWFDLYERSDNSSSADGNIEVEKVLDGKTLTLTVASLNSTKSKALSIPLYDYVGNEVAAVELKQAGTGHDGSATELLLLGEDGKIIVASIMVRLSEALSKYNVIEQYYNYNNVDDLVAPNISPQSSVVNKAWGGLYAAHSQLLMLKDADEKQLNIYADYCNVISAVCYSTLVYGWGDVPYITDYEMMINPNGFPRVEAQEIWRDVKERLTVALENVEEKRNEPLSDINGVFFVSKDVVRVLLANIHMYEGDYMEAQKLLRQVIDNGFYQLDAEGKNEEIYALLCETENRSGVTIYSPAVMPYITLTDVYLTLAEALYQTANKTEAQECITTVAAAKGITLSEGEDVLWNIKQLREQLLLHSGTYFAFLKRSGLAQDACNIEEYRLLLPIPEREMMINPHMIQNPGY